MRNGCGMQPGYQVISQPDKNIRNKLLLYIPYMLMLSQQKMLTSCPLSKMKMLTVMHKHNICVCMYHAMARSKTCFLFKHVWGNTAEVIPTVSSSLKHSPR